MTTAIVYTSKTCPYCKFAIKFLRDRGVKVVTKNVQTKKYAKEMVDKTKQYGIPVTIINGKTILGYDETKLEAAI